MNIKEFYEKMKNILDENVIIINNGLEEYNGVMKDKRVYAFLFDYKIKSIYIGEDCSIIVEIYNS